MTIRYLEDFEPGQMFGSSRLQVEPERIKSFAAEFDPQPFHLNESSARTRSSKDWPRAAGIPRR